MKSFYYKLREQKAITLIALIITIIVLLILAGITVAQLSNNGLFNNAKIAKEKYQKARELEDEIIGDYEDAIAGDRGNKFNYSTEEQEIGTWIDSSTIYEKVIQVTLPSDANWKKVATLENVKNYITAELLYIDLNTYRSTPYMQFSIKGDNNGNNIDINIAVGNSTWYNKSAYIAVKYTK